MSLGGTIMTVHANAETRREHHIPIDLSQPLVLEAHNSSGDVTIRAVDRPDVLVSHDRIDLPWDVIGDEAEVIVQVRDNRIDIRPNPRLGSGWSGFAGAVDLDAVVGQIAKAFRQAGPWAPEKPGKGRGAAGKLWWPDIAIEVPLKMSGRVEINVASGDVRAEGISGEISLKTASGDVRAVHLDGDLALQTASGDVTIEHASGRLAAKTASGDVRVASSQIDAFQIQTANGDIALDVVLRGDEPCRAGTANGDVRLTLRRPAAGGEEPAVALAFQTVAGDAHVSAPFRKAGRRLWQSGADGQGPRIEVTTVSGDLKATIAAVDAGFAPAARPGSPAPAAPPPPPAIFAPPAPPEPVTVPESAMNQPEPEAAQPPAHGEIDRLAVLEAVERGEISIEEALLRLEAADSMTNP
jgi:hypothetical protein